MCEQNILQQLTLTHALALSTQQLGNDAFWCVLTLDTNMCSACSLGYKTLQTQTASDSEHQLDVGGGSPLEYGIFFFSQQLEGLKRDISKAVLERRAEDDVCHVCKYMMTKKKQRKNNREQMFLCFLLSVCIIPPSAATPLSLYPSRSLCA